MAVTTSYNFEDSAEAQDLDFAVATAAVDLASLADGGFVAIGDSAGAIRGTIYSAAGLPGASFGPLTGTNGAIDQLGDGNLVIVGQDADSIVFKVVDGTTGATLVPTTDLNLPGSTNADVVALSGPLGGFFVAYQSNFVSAQNDINVAIRGDFGAFRTAFAIDSSAANDTDAAVAQLDGEDVVVTWTRTVGTDTEIWYAIRSAAGVEVKAPTLFDTQGAINRDVAVTALDGGGFALVYEDDEWTPGESNATLATFDAAGASVGKFDLTVAAFSPDFAPQVTRLANGLLAMTELRGITPFVSLLDPSNGQVLASRDVLDDLGAASVSNAPALAAFGVGRVAAIYSDAAGPFAGGQAHNIVRVSNGDSADDTIVGDDFIDQASGFFGDDTIAGGGGNDRLAGGLDSDTLNGGAGDDTFVASFDGNDILIGGAGIDTVDYSSSGFGLPVTVSLAVAGPQSIPLEATDTLSQIENLIGTSAGDSLSGDGNDNALSGLDDDDVLRGAAGADRLAGGLGNDILDGGPGVDAADFSAAEGPITVDLRLTGPRNTGEGFDTLSSIEDLIGSVFADRFTGNFFDNRFDGGDGADVLRGGSGNDVLNGDSGADLIVGDFGEDVISGGADGDRLFGGTSNDRLFGGAAGDTLAGGPGNDRLDGGDGQDRLYGDTTADTFVFATLAGTGDRVFGFRTGVHDLEFDISVFNGTTGAFAFVANTNPSAATTQQTFLYDTNGGFVYFDRDGTGAAPLQYLLTLYAAPALAAGDILLV